MVSSIFGPSISQPSWWSGSKRYYSTILMHRRDSVQVWVPPDDGRVTRDSPGTLQLQLDVSSDGIRVLDGAGQERGQVDCRWPKLSYTLHRDGGLVWKISARSLVLRRYAVQFASAESWFCHVPFLWSQKIAGVHHDAVRMLGWVGPTKQVWCFAVDPECDNLDVLSLVALLHRCWWWS
jgi:hypothetical protein